MKELERARRLSKKLIEIQEIYKEITDETELLIDCVGFTKKLNEFVLLKNIEMVKNRIKNESK